MREKYIEKKLVEKVKKLGGLCLKWTSPGFTGVPDRIVLMPGGKIYFVELKKENVKPSKRQEVVHRQLRDLGCVLFVIDCEPILDWFIKIISGADHEC